MAKKLPLYLNGYWLVSVRGSVEKINFNLNKKLLFKTSINVGSGWELYELIENKPLLNEIYLSPNSTFKYDVICQRDGPMAIFLSEAKEVSEHLRSNIITRFGNVNFWPIRINVNSFVHKIVESPKNVPYYLTGAHVKTASTSNVRSISFYGSNVGKSSIFSNNLNLFNCYRCGLREKKDSSELLQIGNDGNISFNLGNPKKLLKIEGLLNYLKTTNYIELPEIMNTK